MKKKRILALMLVLIMSILSACGTKKTTDVKKEATTSNTGMGRYVEESVELPEISGHRHYLRCRMEHWRYSTKTPFV